MSPRIRRAATAAVALLCSLALGQLGSPSASGTPSYTLIEGSGSSWSANAINTWIADVLSLGMQVTFTSQGSAQGRKDFAKRTTDYGVTDIGFQGVDVANQNTADTNQGRPYAYLPIAAGGTAIVYNLKSGGEQIKSLRLSGETLTKIFTSRITQWNDPQIAKDNPGVPLPPTTIVPVVHSEGSGSTAQFTRFMAKQYPDLWRAYAPKTFDKPGDDSGMTEYFPVPDGSQMIAQNGSDQVINYITSGSGDGTIGYDEYSFALGKKWPVAKILNAAGYYTLPTQYNVAKALTAAVIDLDQNSPNYLLQDLDAVYGLNEPAAYPLSSYSYMLLPTGAAGEETRLNSSKRQTLADFTYYSICQGQGEIGPIGYSSLPINLVQAGFDQIGRLKAADPAVDLNQRDVANCQNPTFDPSDPSANRLATLAPIPPDCDRYGQPVCSLLVIQFNENPPPVGESLPSGDGGTAPDGASDPAGGGGTAASTGGAPVAAGQPAGGSGGPGGGGAVAAPSIDPETGEFVADGAGPGGGRAVSTELAASRTNGPTAVLGPLAVVELVLALVAPVLMARHFGRRRRHQ